MKKITSKNSYLYAYRNYINAIEITDKKMYFCHIKELIKEKIQELHDLKIIHEYTKRDYKKLIKSLKSSK